MSAVPARIPAQSMSTAPLVAAASPSVLMRGVPASDPVLPVNAGAFGTATAATGVIDGQVSVLGLWSMPEMELGLRPFFWSPDRLVHPARTFSGIASQ